MLAVAMPFGTIGTSALRLESGPLGSPDRGGDRLFEILERERLHEVGVDAELGRPARGAALAHADDRQRGHGVTQAFRQAARPGPVRFEDERVAGELLADA